MKFTTPAKKTQERLGGTTRRDSATGPNAMSITPPGYGIDFVDRATKTTSSSVVGGLGGVSTTPLGHSHPVLQAKLTVNQPGDVYEQEADRVADQVMRMPEPAPGSPAPASGTSKLMTPSIQRMCPECEEETKLQRAKFPDEEDELQLKADDEDEEILQAKQVGDAASAAGSSTPRLTSGVESQIRALRGSGQPLDPAICSFMESRFGRDFSGVSIHTDARANHLARSVNAKAFTTGSDIVFRSGQYNPATATGKHLLAHELTHVVQQAATEPLEVPDKHAPSTNPAGGSVATPIIQRMSITQVGTPPKLDCGSYRYRWKFELDNPAPSEGFMVQHVKIRESKADCSKPEVKSIAVKPVDEFWESWHVVKKGDRVSVETKRYGYSDQFSESSKPSSTGTHADTGKVKFFKISTTGDLNKLWTPNRYSGILPATSTKPAWWNNPPIDSGFHWASSWWKCCGDRKNWWNKTDAHP